MQRKGILLLFISLILCTLTFVFLSLRDSLQAAILVEWDTASEVDSVGYNLYRSTMQDQGFIKINPELVPVSSEPFKGGHYSYLDVDVIVGKIYYYQLEEINTYDAVTRYNPIQIEAKPNITINLVIAILCAGATGLFGAWDYINRRAISKDQEG